MSTQSPEEHPEQVLSDELIRSACTFAAKTRFSSLLIIADEIVAPENLSRKSVKNKVVYAVTNEVQAKIAEDVGYKCITIPDYTYTRMEKVKVALVSAFSSALFKHGDNIVCLTGTPNTKIGLDTLMLLTIGDEKLTSVRDTSWSDLSSIADDTIPVQLLEVILKIATLIGQQGYEGRPTGTILVVGDSTAVMEKSRQLYMNPLQGYSEVERNINDPKIQHTIKSFAMLDGATVIREDGVVLATGRYLDIGGKGVSVAHPGLGTRHQSAAAISALTGCISVVVSQTSGQIRVFKKGELCLDIQPSSRRTMSPAQKEALEQAAESND